MSLCCLVNPQVSYRPLYAGAVSYSPLEETAVLISKVAASECSSGFGIDVPVEMDSMKQNVLVCLIYIRVFGGKFMLGIVTFLLLHCVSCRETC